MGGEPRAEARTLPGGPARPAVAGREATHLAWVHGPGLFRSLNLSLAHVTSGHLPDPGRVVTLLPVPLVRTQPARRGVWESSERAGARCRPISSQQEMAVGLSSSALLPPLSWEVGAGSGSEALAGRPTSTGSCGSGPGSWMVAGPPLAPRAPSAGGGVGPEAWNHGSFLAAAAVASPPLAGLTCSPGLC